MKHTDFFFPMGSKWWLSPVITSYMQIKFFHSIQQFDNAFLRLGFSDYKFGEKLVTLADQQVAILRIFDLAGYLNKDELWQDINHIYSITDKKNIFLAIVKAMDKSSGNYSLMRNEFTKTPLNSEQWMDLLLYISQHAFSDNFVDRLAERSWMELHKSEYIKAAAMLGLIDKKLLEYDLVLIINGAAKFKSKESTNKYSNDDFIIIDANTLSGSTTTSYIISEAIEFFIEQIQSGEYAKQKYFKILVQTSNPYIEDVNRVVQGKIDELLKEQNIYDFIIEEVVADRQDISRIYSELACLIEEKWKSAHDGQEFDQHIIDLLFATRTDYIIQSDMPSLGLSSEFHLDYVD